MQQPLVESSQLDVPQHDPLNILQSLDYLGIPETLVPDLVDAFFSHLYNSRLLLHRAKFDEDRKRQRVRPHTILAICAMGAKYAFLTYLLYFLLY